MLNIGLRTMVGAAFMLGLAMLLVDAGSVTFTRLAVQDQVREAGYAAAQAAEGREITQQTALRAYEAAADQAATAGNRVRATDFTLHRDGRVTLTAGRIAPTLLMHRFPRFGRFVEITRTETVQPLPYRSDSR